MFLSEWREFPSAPCLARKNLDSSRLDVVEIARVPDMFPSLLTSWSGKWAMKESACILRGRLFCRFIIEWSSKETSLRFQCWKWRFVVPLGCYFPNPAGKGTPAWKTSFVNCRDTWKWGRTVRSAQHGSLQLWVTTKTNVWSSAEASLCLTNPESAMFYKLSCFFAGPAAFLDKLIVIQLVEKLSNI